MLRIASKAVSTRLLYCRREYSLIIMGKMSVFAWFNSHIVRQTIATLLRQTIAILLRRQFTSNPNGARACLRVQARPARL